MEDSFSDPSSVLKVVIVGCGNIGSKLDEMIEGDSSLTHAGSYSQLGIEISAISDSNAKRLKEAGEYWNVVSQYEDFNEMFQKEKPDLVSICTPSHLRHHIFKAAIRSGVKYFYCEKPIAENLTDAIRIQSLLKESGATAIVNYLRRWDENVVVVKKLLDTNQIGDIQLINAHYDKGLLNNGSHIISLLNYFFGVAEGAKSLEEIDDGRNDDLTVHCRLEYIQDNRAFPCYFHALDYRHYSLFEVDIIGSKGRIQLLEGGRKYKIYRVEEDRDFPGYYQLEHEETLSDTLSQNAFLRAARHVIDVAEGKHKTENIISGIDEAVDVLRVIDSIRRYK